MIFRIVIDFYFLLSSDCKSLRVKNFVIFLTHHLCTKQALHNYADWTDGIHRA